MVDRSTVAETGDHAADRPPATRSAAAERARARRAAVVLVRADLEQRSHRDPALRALLDGYDLERDLGDVWRAAYFALEATLAGVAEMTS